ncbi:hypothetical protein EVAR_23218_1 [Eumeta japonica]|uniref:Uncharacterized protein n=1 Tax=Eumeta variegata TaxID=151549 RepID=A0A4C1VDM4_EUMVA|nr:hypothetical protein EVAR_23218_1 [Eumeta japonica]
MRFEIAGYAPCKCWAEIFYTKKENVAKGGILDISPPWCEYPDESAPLVPRLGHRDFQENSLDGCEGHLEFPKYKIKGCLILTPCVALNDCRGPIAILHDCKAYFTKIDIISRQMSTAEKNYLNKKCTKSQLSGGRAGVASETSGSMGIDFPPSVITWMRVHQGHRRHGLDGRRKCNFEWHCYFLTEEKEREHSFFATERKRIRTHGEQLCGGEANIVYYACREANLRLDILSMSIARYARPRGRRRSLTFKAPAPAAPSEAGSFFLCAAKASRVNDGCDFSLPRPEGPEAGNSSVKVFAGDETGKMEWRWRDSA